MTPLLVAVLGLLMVAAAFCPAWPAWPAKPSDREQAPMVETADPLVLDFVEWIAREPRSYSEVIATWRTSCPRLTIWEDAVDQGYVARETVAGVGLIVTVTEDGERLLRENSRMR